MIAPIPTENEDDARLLLAEVEQLPEQYQSAVILCYLEGKTQQEAAACLGITPGAVKGRLERGKSLLKDRLVKQGVGMSVVLAAWQMQQTSAMACVTTALVQSTTQACVGSVVVTAGGAAGVTTSLFKGAVLMSSKTKIALAGALVTLMAVGGGATNVLSSSLEQGKNAEAGINIQGEAAESVSEVSVTLEELISFVTGQETLYGDIEVRENVNFVRKKRLLEPPVGFAVDPFEQMDVFSPSGGLPSEPLPVHEHRGKSIVHAVRKGDQFWIENAISGSEAICHVMKSERVRLENGGGIVRQVPVEMLCAVPDQTYTLSYDGATLMKKENTDDVHRIEVEALRHAVAMPHSLLLRARFPYRPLSEVLAGGTPGEGYVSMVGAKWTSKCEVVREEMVGEESTVVVKCTSNSKEADNASEWNTYFYLAVDKNYIPIKVTSVADAGDSKGSVEMLEVTAWQELEPGLWYPRNATVTVSSEGDSSRGRSETIEYEIISLNPNYPDEFFRYKEDE